MEKSYFPILVRFTDTNEYAVVETPEALPDARGFKVIRTNYWRGSCGGDTQAGDRVLYIPHNGRDYDHTYAQKSGLVPLQEYTVETVTVDRWYTELTIIGYPGNHNSVLFVRLDT
jgi:hypothetical protein